ncbi:alpha/beta hydrolase [Anaerosalibacter massiliensis]|uniref:Alpha/beta hydrolase n=1 Tax=Anaerosalibacter massiliensis TaxID=1347392 RepID=A0A9X2S5Z5_9FIRM|nr:alpha/beta hydrolase [Anaerosalibacter massiliensis]MCR2045090.1 alpha/beta hydrolase [Anaerosalibacter massiliensis]
MNIDFKYIKKEIEYVSGYIFKGKNYRCSYVRYNTLYKNPASGTENVELYNFTPRGNSRASTLVLHGLGSRNIKFLLWIGPHLASAGVNTTILILPGNYTRVENNSVSGKSFLYPDIETMYQFWEHSVIDTLTTIDLLEQKKLWKNNNVVMGYCLGGMITTIVGSIDKRINHKLFMTTGGHLPKILHESPTTNFARKLFNSGHEPSFYLNNKEYLYNIYNDQFPEVRKMSFSEIIDNKYIHPLFKIDPIAYAHLLDMSEVTFIDALFDNTLPFDSRKILYREMEGAKRRVLPISHVNWLPFEYILAKYILHKLNINDKKSRKALLQGEIIENPLEKDSIIGK